MAGIEPACLPLGDQDGRQLPYYTRISKPTAQERWRGGATRCGRVCCLLPGQLGQGVSALTLRRTHSRQIHAGASFAEMAARSFTGLERKGGRCCTAPFRYAGQPVSKFPGFHGKQPRRRRGLTPFAALPPIRSALRHIKSSPASAVQGCLSYAREELCFVSAALFLS